MKHKKHYTLSYIAANTPADTARDILDYVKNQIITIGRDYFPGMGCRYWADAIQDDINAGKYSVDEVNRHIREYNEFCNSFKAVLHAN